MPFGRAILAASLALAWCWGVWHAELEGAGLMVEHAHHHDGDSSHDHSGPPEVDDHSPVWARAYLQDSTWGVAAAVLLAIILGLGTLRFLLEQIAAPNADRTRRRSPEYLPVWQFVRRCAANSAAPPALS